MTSTATTNSDSKVNLLVTRDVLHALNKEALRFPDIETAVGVVGLHFEDGTIALTGIIPAPARDVVRNVATAQLGGKDLKDAFEWLAKNHHALNPKTEIEFFFAGKAHSHQKISFNVFSSTDEQSMLGAVEKHGAEFQVWPLLLISEFKSEVSVLGQMQGTVSVSSRTNVRIRFYYLDKKMVGLGRRTPVLVKPQVIDAKGLPVVLPKLPWRYADEDSFRRQLRQLDEYGAKTIVIHHNVDDDPEDEVQFIIQHPDWRKTLIITTNWDYPRTQPVVRVISSSGEIKIVTHDVHKAPIWTSESDFIDIVFELLELEEL